MKKAKKFVYHVGDIVKVVHPLVVKRVGYPWNKKHIKEKVITKKQKKALWACLDRFGLMSEPAIRPLMFIDRNEGLFDKLLDEIAYELGRKNGWGGTKRKVFCEAMEELRGKECRIVGKRCVQSGTYNHGCSGRGGYYDDEWDYDPPHLSDVKAHVLLKLDIFPHKDIWAHPVVHSGEFPEYPEIEEVNVELVKKRT